MSITPAHNKDFPIIIEADCDIPYITVQMHEFFERFLDFTSLPSSEDEPAMVTEFYISSPETPVLTIYNHDYRNQTKAQFNCDFQTLENILSNSIDALKLNEAKLLVFLQKYFKDNGFESKVVDRVVRRAQSNYEEHMLETVFGDTYLSFYSLIYCMKDSVIRPEAIRGPFATHVNNLIFADDSEGLIIFLLEARKSLRMFFKGPKVSEARPDYDFEKDEPLEWLLNENAKISLRKFLEKQAPEYRFLLAKLYKSLMPNEFEDLDIEDHIPENNSFDLNSLSPVVLKGMDMVKLGRLIGENYAKDGFSDLFRFQAEELSPIWQAFDDSFREQDFEKNGLEAQYNADLSLGKLFFDNTFFTGILQMQRPIIIADRDADKEEGFLDLAAEDYLSLDYSDYSNVNGGSNVCAFGEDDIIRTGFGFVSVTYSDEKTAEDAALRRAGLADAKKRKVTALPVLSIDPYIAKLDDCIDLKKTLSPLQDIISIANHDYFHQLTARVIAPYALARGDQSLYSEVVGEFGLRDVSGRLGALRRAWNGVEEENKHLSEYAPPGKESYEFVALFMHAQLYMNHLHYSDVGRQMEGHFEALGECVNDAMDELRDQGMYEEAHCLGFFAMTTAMYNIKRLVPDNHPLTKHAEKVANQLTFDVSFLERQVADADWGEKINWSFVQPFDVINGFVKQRIKGDLDFLFSQEPKAIAARDNALKDSRLIYSAVEGDFKWAEKKYHERLNRPKFPGSAS